MAAEVNASKYQPRVQSQHEQDVYEESMREFRELTTWRNVFAGQWEETAELIAPNYRNTFFYGNQNWPGQKKTFRQIDASGMQALAKFAAICDSLLTPRNMFWHQLGPEHPELMKSRKVRLWFEQVTRLLFHHRYLTAANFAGQNHQVYTLLGAFGNGPMFIDKL